MPFAASHWLAGGPAVPATGRFVLSDGTFSCWPRLCSSGGYSGKQERGAAVELRLEGMNESETDSERARERAHHCRLQNEMGGQCVAVLSAAPPPAARPGRGRVKGERQAEEARG